MEAEVQEGDHLVLGIPQQEGLIPLVPSLSTLFMVAVDKVTSRGTPSGTVTPSTSKIGKKL